MDDKQRAEMLNAGRTFFGAGMVLAPSLMLKGWVGEDAKLPSVKLVGRTMGVRDAALGIGTLMALRDGKSAKLWLQLGIAADAVDCAATLLAARRIPTRGAILVGSMAAAAAVTGWQLMQRLD